MKIEYFLKSFNELSNSELYEILKLRSEVFVVEQNSIYLDFDGYDQNSLHLFGKDNDLIVCYGRILPPKLAYNECSIGRIVVKKNYRKYKFGQQLVENLLVETQNLYPNQTIKIMAQSYLIHFYKNYGFEIIGDEFIEDTILHNYMLLKK